MGEVMTQLPLLLEVMTQLPLLLEVMTQLPPLLEVMTQLPPLLEEMIQLPPLLEAMTQLRLTAAPTLQTLARVLKMNQKMELNLPHSRFLLFFSLPSLLVLCRFLCIILSLQ